MLPKRMIFFFFMVLQGTFGSVFWGCIKERHDKGFFVEPKMGFLWRHSEEPFLVPVRAFIFLCAGLRKHHVVAKNTCFAIHKHSWKLSRGLKNTQRCLLTNIETL